MSENERIELYILSKQHLQHVVLPLCAQGNKTLYLQGETHKEERLRVYARKHDWYYALEEEKHTSVRLEMNHHYEIEVHHESYLLLTSLYQKATHQFHGYRCLKKEWSIGRGEDCDIIYSHKAISFHHARIFQDKDGWHLEDLNSRNGCFVNGRRVMCKDLKCKDRVQILELMIVIGDSTFFINDVQNCVCQPTLQPYQVPQKACKRQELALLTPMYLFEEEVVKKTFDIDMPPSLPDQEEVSFLLSLGPSFTMGLSSLSMGVFALFQVSANDGNILQSIPTLVMSFSMAAGSILWPLLSRHHTKKKKKRLTLQLQQSYHAYLCEVEEEIEKELHSYETTQRKLHLCLEEVLTALSKQQRFLLETSHPAFLHTTLGYGNLLYPVQFQEKRQGFLMEKNALFHELEDLFQRTFQAENIPITLSFQETKLVYISGKQRKKFLLKLLFQTALLHHEENLHILLHIDEETAYTSGAIYLPHLRLANGERGIVMEKSESNLHKKLYRFKKEEWCIIFDFFDKESSLEDVNASITRLQCIAKKEPALSAHCAAIHLEEETGSLYKEHTMMNFYYTLAKTEELRKVAALLANQQKAPFISSQKTLHFLDMMQCGSVEDLNIQERWEKGNPSRSFSVCIGRKANQEPLLLDLHEQAHGPHGLIAGMTGSGKSECLLTLILSLCINYSPDKVSFLLIDYKGGTMASTLRKLPHVAGVITNLAKDGLQRAFLALESELLLRQRCMSEAALRFDRGNMNIAQYEELCRIHTDIQPLSHLLIIADEFAELKVQQPAFMEQLKQTARIGRSLGIHLLLATQKPAGVIDDQIWSNAHFHLCMKVQTVQDSMDMLKKEDAVYLKKAGECCLQVGYDEVYERGMIAWARSPYHKKEVYEEEHFDEVVLQSGDGNTLEHRHIKKTANVTQTQMEAIIQELCGHAKKENCNARPLWKEPLQKELLVSEYPCTLALIDDLSTQQQNPLNYQEETMTHTFLFGSSMEDMTMYLTTFLYVATLHTNKRIQVYILDFAQHELTIFLHHEGIIEVINEEETEKVDTFFYRLKKEIAQRKKGNKNNLFLMLIHHYECFHELYSTYEEVVYELLREGNSLQMYVYITAMSVEALPYRFLQLPHDTLVFQLQDSKEYRHILQDEHELQPSGHRGSGLLLYEGRVCLFQTLLTSNEEIAHLAKAASWQKPYELPVMPKQIAHPIYGRPLYLGKELLSKEDFYVDIETYSLVYLCAATQLNNSVALWIAQLETCKKVVVIHPDGLYYHGQKLLFTSFKQVLKDADILIWQNPYACKETEIQNYLQEQIVKDHKTQVFIFTMREQMEYHRYEWFMAGFYEAMILWMGKGFYEVRHLFHNTALPQLDLKKNQGLFMEEDTWTTFQLWEVKSDG